MGIIQPMIDLINKVAEGLKKIFKGKSKGGSSTKDPLGDARKAKAESDAKFGPMKDFVMRPGHSPVSFSPDDTIIGMKNPGMMGGGITVNIERIYGTDPNEIARALRLKLLDLVSI